jgi:hypothetical protein
MSIVDKYPSDFNLDPTLSNDGVKEDTRSTRPSDSGGVPATTTDPPNLISFQAIVDNTLGDPDLNDDLLSLRIRDFTSATSKILDGAIHEFCHDLMRVDGIIEDLQADCIDPDSFVSTQDFNYRIQSIAQGIVDPVQITLRNDLNEMKDTYAKILLAFNVSNKANAKIFAQSMEANNAVIRSTLAALGTTVTTHLESVSTINVSVVSHITRVASDITTLDTRMAKVESLLAQVVSTVDSLHTQLMKMGDSISSLAQTAQGLRSPPRTPPVTPSPFDDSPGIPGMTGTSQGLPSSYDEAVFEDDAPNAAGSRNDDTDDAKLAPHVHRQPDGQMPHNHWTNVDPASFTSSN